MKKSNRKKIIEFIKPFMFNDLYEITAVEKYCRAKNFYLFIADDWLTKWFYQDWKIYWEIKNIPIEYYTKKQEKELLDNLIFIDYMYNREKLFNKWL